MDNKLIAKQLVEFHKSTFDNTFNSLGILQEQTERMVNTFLQQATWLPAEGKDAVKNWVNIYKKGRIDFKEAAEKNYKKVEEYFSAGETAPKAKTAKTK
jgi:hypothetical protein